ncbi:MAG: tetraacyldisaccharide 4'-kinase [Fimbriimonadaceae bacterium]
MSTEDLWFSQTPVAKFQRAMLTPASWLYALGWESYASIYRLGLKWAEEAHRPVVCIGNLVVGGAGKTPATIATARVLTEMGKHVVISASGYGSPRSAGASIAPSGPLLAAEWGDEPAMIRWLMPDTPLIIGRRRVLAAELATQQFPDAVLLMDDGFQHLPLRKHVTVLLDADPPPNAKCLPAGPYREPRRNRNKADLVLGDQFKFVRQPLGFIDTTGRQASPPNEAVMLCAIGAPEPFAQALQAAGIRLASQLRRPDHDPLTAGNLFDGLDRNTALVVTAKDWVKLKVRPDLADRRILIALQDAQVEPAAEFKLWLAERLARVRAT